MVKIKAITVRQCPLCGNKGSIQVFFNRQNKIKYGRTRHYKGLSENKKPQFTYCKLDDLSQLETLLFSLNFKFPQAQPKHLGHKTKQDFHAQTSISLLRGQPKNSSILEMAGGVGFEPTTPTLGG